MLKTLTPRGLTAVVVLLVLVTGTFVWAGRALAQESPSIQHGAVHHASGTFEVSMAPGDPEAVEAGLGLSRYILTKTFTGGLTGHGVGQMLAGGPEGSETVGSYVAIERFVGTLDGHKGAFLLAHRGDMAGEDYSLSITVVPGSGTGALAGIAGDFKLTVENGVHHYDLAYTLPQ
ncbi:hypothetical protein BH10PSE1_BH10PSE1_19800 [soil metagenome]